jgi:hypothetical protein
VRELPLREAAAFARHLRQALQSGGLAPDQLVEVLDRAAVCECVQCGIRLGAGDLVALGGDGTPDPALGAKAARVRQGYCARNGCASYFYRFTVQPHPGIDWPVVLGLAQSAADQAASVAAAETRAQRAGQRLARWRLLLKVAAGLAVVVVLLVARQWMVGGRIPLLREPEPFTVDPKSVEAGGRR